MVGQLVKPSKRLLPMLMLDILQRYTDCKHRLSQNGIKVILKNEFDL